VVADEISKLAISNEGEVIKKKIDVIARKIPFKDIRNHGCPGFDGTSIQAMSWSTYSLQRRYKTLSTKKTYSPWACWNKRRLPSIQRHES